jgi:hypothetical protein
VFNGCSSNRTDKVRSTSVFANAIPVCKATETQRTWNQIGPAGQDGQQGPSGPRGPSDAFSQYREVGDARGPISVPMSGVTVGTLSLPAGSYVLAASLDFTNDSPDAGIAYCLLLVGDRNAQVLDSEAGHQAVSQALTVASALSTAGTATLTCKNNGSGGNLSIETFNLNAIAVGTLTFQ